MNPIGGKCVFFVRDTPAAIQFYTSRLGFALDWTYEENGRPLVVQVSLLGLQVILNQAEGDTRHRPGSGRLFLGLNESQTAAVLQHAEAFSIEMTYTRWGEPTAVIRDLDQNEFFLWFSDAERLKWQQRQDNRS